MDLIKTTQQSKQLLLLLHMMQENDTKKHTFSILSQLHLLSFFFFREMTEERKCTCTVPAMLEVETLKRRLWSARQRIEKVQSGKNTETRVIRGVSALQQKNTDKIKQ